jgi:hypothetical protein
VKQLTKILKVESFVFVFLVTIFVVHLDVVSVAHTGKDTEIICAMDAHMRQILL